MFDHEENNKFLQLKVISSDCNNCGFVYFIDLTCILVIYLADLTTNRLNCQHKVIRIVVQIAHGLPQMEHYKLQQLLNDRSSILSKETLPYDIYRSPIPVRKAEFTRFMKHFNLTLYFACLPFWQTESPKTNHSKPI